MLKLRMSDSDQVVVDITVTRPTVYLDYCVMAESNRNEKIASSIRDTILEKNGTLYWSFAHLIELSSLGLGNTFSKIKSYLTSFGTNIAPLEVNPKDVYEREKYMIQRREAPQFDGECIETMVGCWDGLSHIDLGSILQVLEKNPSIQNFWKKQHSEMKKEFRELFLNAKQEYKKNPKFIDKFDIAISLCSPNPPHTEYIYNKLLKECITHNDNFKENDTFDFYHSVVSTAYSDFAVFDTKWTQRLRDINLPKDTAKLFSITELDQFLNELKQFHPTPQQTSCGEKGYSQ